MVIKMSRFRMNMGGLPINDASTINFNGATSGTASLTVAAVAGTPTITLPGATGTLATLTKRVTTVSDATSITPNSDTADIIYQSNSQAVGTLNIYVDGGTPTNGRSMLIKIKSTNVQTFSWDGSYVGGANALPATTTGGGNIDYYSFIYDTVNSKWHYTGTATGF